MRSQSPNRSTSDLSSFPSPPFCLTIRATWEQVLFRDGSTERHSGPTRRSRHLPCRPTMTIWNDYDKPLACPESQPATVSCLPTSRDTEHELLYAECVWVKSTHRTSFAIAVTMP
jgi:hypothetical protein